MSPIGAKAQTDAIGPLHMQPQQADMHQSGRQKSDLHEWFIYQYMPQELPIMDDFSSDRTRHLDARSDDAGVTLQETVYHLEVAGVSTSDMAFMLEPTYTYTFDVQPDTTIIDTIENPSVSVLVTDISTFPVSSQTLTLWPPTEILDSLGIGQDTTWLAPDFVQDSLFVYDVPPQADLYDCAPGSTPLILWEDDDVFINGTYPVDPPTVGVATFEGLDRTGYPYDFDLPTAYGLCDRMTSVPIDLLYPESDSIYLSFFYQPQGLSGDGIVQNEDSLRLEFYAPQEDLWYEVWSVGYTALQPFDQVMLKVEQDRFRKNGFRMRFSNMGTRSGALDHWHLDYVRLDRQRAYDDTVLVDVTYVMPESTLLSLYTSVPFAHFAANPGQYMTSSVTGSIKNLRPDPAFVTYGYDVRTPDGTVLHDYSLGTNTAAPPFSTFATNYPVTNDGFTYPAPVTDTCAYFDVTLYSNSTPDINRCNDTMRFTQEFTSYYAYDDGSAEAGYFLNSPGKVAVRFDMVGSDTLRAVRIYFDPIYEDPSTSSFLLTVWTSLIPESILQQNVSFSSPEYVRWGPNHFVEYELDDPVVVSGTFYVGFVQSSTVKLNIGFDRNRDNGDKLYYKVSGAFAQTTQEGSLMLRPVFKVKSDPFLGVEEPLITNANLHLFPNPAQDLLNVHVDNANGAPLQADVVDATGRLISSERIGGHAQLAIGQLPVGLYMLHLRNLSGAVLATERFVVQR
ncbi:MAG: T9SS type A sorting domain-containing protein [Flavobacteriales bacterium]